MHERSRSRARQSGKFYAAMENLHSGVVGVRRGLHTHKIRAACVVDPQNRRVANF